MVPSYNLSKSNIWTPKTRDQYHDPRLTIPFDKSPLHREGPIRFFRSATSRPSQIQNSVNYFSGM